MAEGRARLEWAQTSAVLSMMGNAAGGKRGGGWFCPADFDPYEDRDGRCGRGGGGVRITRDNIDLLQAAFGDALHAGQKSDKKRKVDRRGAENAENSGEKRA